MIKCKCIKKNRSKNNKIVSYTLQDSNGQIITMNSDILKNNIKNKQIDVINLKLTSDNRLVDFNIKQDDTAKNSVKIVVNPDSVLVNGMNTIKFKYGYRPDEVYSAFVRCDTQIRNKDYFAVIIHDCNPGCYKYLDKILIVNLKDGRSKEIKYSDFIESVLRFDTLHPSKLSFSGNDIVVHSSRAPQLLIKTDLLFSKLLTNGTKVSPKLDMNKPYTWFDYRIVAHDDIIMQLKNDVDLFNLIELPGFDMNYNAFKFSGSVVGYGQSSLLMINTKTGNSWEVNYGISTTMASDEVWRKRDKLIAMMKEAVPNYVKIHKVTVAEEL